MQMHIQEEVFLINLQKKNYFCIDLFNIFLTLFDFTASYIFNLLY